MLGESNGFKQKPPRAATAPTVDEIVGCKVQRRRLALELAVDELAQIVGISSAQLEAFESGKKRIDPQRLTELAGALGVSVAWFFMGVDE